MTTSDQCAARRGSPIRPSTVVRVVLGSPPEPGGLDWHLYDATGTRLASYATGPEANAAADVWRALSDMPAAPCPDPTAHGILRNPIQPLADLFRTAMGIADIVSPNRGEITAGSLADPKHADALRAFVGAVIKMETAP